MQIGMQYTVHLLQHLLATEIGVQSQRFASGTIADPELAPLDQTVAESTVNPRCDPWCANIFSSSESYQLSTEKQRVSYLNKFVYTPLGNEEQEESSGILDPPDNSVGGGAILQ